MSYAEGDLEDVVHHHAHTRLDADAGAAGDAPGSKYGLAELLGLWPDQRQQLEKPVMPRFRSTEAPPLAYGRAFDRR